MKISEFSAFTAAVEFLKTAKNPFFITLVLSFFSVLLNDSWSKIFNTAIFEQPALTLIKLCFMVGVMLLALAFVFRKWPFIFKLLHNAGDFISGIGFYGSASAAGVVLGLFGGLAVEFTLLKAGLLATYLALLFVASATMLWVAAVAHKEFVSIKNVWVGAVLSFTAILLAFFAAASLYCEKWSEIEGLNLNQNEQICRIIEHIGKRQ